MVDMNSKNLKDHVDDLEETFSFWGKREPYFCVLTASKFLLHNMTDQGKMSDQALDHFYSLGESDIRFAFEILEHNGININPTMALDFGCGVGRLTFALAKIFCFVIGCDISEPHLEIARDNACQFGINNVHFIKSSANLLDRLSPESFDFIYSRLVLQHIPPILSKAYIRQFTSLLKAGGYMLIQLPTTSPAYAFNPEASDSPASNRMGNDRVIAEGDADTSGPKVQMFSLEIREVLEAINEGRCQLIDLVFETGRDGWTSHVFLVRKDG
ncbi:MAG: class I SAM-dependent methyltransferase [Geobacteraceae bacterium]|nr:class I SAM-dependent methyltransferase [Geobacteraceae bacterium]NTW79373.1 class I SAM-dependent methyltransferase [Geobacteraceae bacterium]